MDPSELQEEFDKALERNLASRQRLSKESVQRLFSRKSLEQGMLECFELIGGVPRLAIWANDPENYGEFLKLLMKFAPKDAIEKASASVTYISNVPASPLNKGAEVLEHDPKSDE